MKTKFKIEGMKELQRDLNKLGLVPQKYVNSAAKKGMNIVLKDAKSNAPTDTGELKKGIISVAERSSKTIKGKKLYRLVFDRKKNYIFQRRNEEGEITGYYPISQEYGYFTRNGRYIPGFRFTRDSLTLNTSKVEKMVVTTMKQKIDMELRKAGLK